MHSSKAIIGGREELSHIKRTGTGHTFWGLKTLFEHLLSRSASEDSERELLRYLSRY